MDLLLKALRDNDLDILKHMSKIIALVIRNEIEDFHVAYLSDGQMKELNPLIRKGVYNAMYALVNQHKDSFSREYIEFFSKSIPDYWEDPVLIPKFKYSNEATNPEITFKSEFLKEQYKLKNISYDPIKGFLQIRPSYEFADVEYNHRKRHRDKIRTQLIKANYYYDYYSNAYFIKDK